MTETELINNLKDVSNVAEWKISTNIGTLKTSTLWKKFHLDGPLLCGIIVLFAISFIVLYSADSSNMALLKRHFIRISIALCVMFFIAQVPPRILRVWAIYVYAAGIIMLICVLFFGDVTKGAQRWLNFGFVRFQPAELMKLAVPILVADYFHQHVLPPSFKQLIIPLAIILTPFLLISIQPDLGTALLIASSGLLVIYFAGISWKIIVSSIILVISSLPVLWLLLHDYQKKRILTLLDPERDPFGSGYHIIQSKIAIGSGGLYGKGWLNGSQSHLDYIPERTTDFIFSVFSEEFGFSGILFLLLAYTFIILRGLFISMQAQDTFCRLLAGSLVMTLFVYLFVNIGMVTGILPIVGIPLPMISYGGTSLITLIIGFGILMSIKTNKTLVKK